MDEQSRQSSSFNRRRQNGLRLPLCQLFEVASEVDKLSSPSCTVQPAMIHVSLEQPLFPPGSIEETLRTLALLFPQNDDKTRRWVTGQNKSDYRIDPAITSCGSLRAQDRRFEKFFVWHDRLIVLKQAFDDSRPQSLGQWWRDRRNGVQWYTFWIALWVFIFTIFFGVVQCVEGGLQVYLSYKALQT